jgi:hypothetical protein
MTTLGVQMMMLKDRVSEEGMYPVLQRITDLGYDSVEVSQIPMDEAKHPGPRARRRRPRSAGGSPLRGPQKDADGDR